MRIVGGAWRGRTLSAPAGRGTRPTADRVRQALFDMLLHAPWGGRHVVEGARVLDAFAGTGAMGLEALSRGAAFATFIEQDRQAVAALRANVAVCRAEDRTEVMAVDVQAAPAARETCGLVFLDPPYGLGLVARGVERLRERRWIGQGTLVVAEMARDEAPPACGELLAERTHGAAKLIVYLSRGVGEVGKRSSSGEGDPAGR